MNAFHLDSASPPAILVFFERTPPQPDRPIERFKVRLSHLDLEGVARVYVGDSESHPASLFSEMAERWRGWEGRLTWESSGGELSLACTQDRAGHVAIRVRLRSGPTPDDWTIEATLVAEAGQLEALARNARLFFGAVG